MGERILPSLFPQFPKSPEKEGAEPKIPLLNLERMERDEAIESLFRVEKNPERERKEFTELLEAYQNTLGNLREQGQGVRVESTIRETFERNRIEQAVIAGDGTITLVPRVSGGSLIVVSDVHGYRPGVELAAREFLRDPEKHHLASLGDMINEGPDQVAIMKALLKLAITYPENVHLHPGNHEAFYREYLEEMLQGEMKEEQFWRSHLKRTHGSDATFNASLRLFKQLPLILMTENGLVAVHGNLPGPFIKKKGEHTTNLNLQELVQWIHGSRRSGRSVFKLVEREKSKHGEKGLKDRLHPHEFQKFLPYYGEKAILGAQDGIGATVQLVGHQHSYARQFGREAGHPGFAITHKNRVGTFCTLPNQGIEKREGAIVKIPLDRPLEKLEDRFFLPIEYPKE